MQLWCCAIILTLSACVYVRDILGFCCQEDVSGEALIAGVENWIAGEMDDKKSKTLKNIAEP